MNTKRILIGGAVAGAVVAAGETILNLMVLRTEVASGLMSGMPVGVFLVRSVALGLGCALLYAAVRPRMGAGPKTAVTAGLMIFLFGVLFPTFGLAGSAAPGSDLLLISIIWSAVELPLATVAGGWLYREAEAPARDRAVPA